MSSFSIDSVWEDTIVFLRRESGLVLPLALATFGLATIMLGFVAQPMAAAGAGAKPPANIQFLWTFPALLLTIVGNLSVSLMVLRPQTSVGESLRTALSRLLVAIGVSLLVGVIAMVVLIATVIVVTVLGTIWQANMQMRINQTLFIAMLPIGWLTLRLLVMWPVVADGKTGPIVALRRSFALTKGNAMRALIVTMIFGAVYISLISISQLALVPVVRIVGMATGQTDLLQLISELIVAFIGSVLMMAWTVFLAFAYRRLSA